MSVNVDHELESCHIGKHDIHHRLEQHVLHSMREVVYLPKSNLARGIVQ